MFLICGEALFDVFAHAGDDDSAAAIDFRAVAGGSPFNVAFGLSRLGGKSALLTGVSSDFLGERLIKVLEREGVDCQYLVREGDCKTTIAMVALGPNGSPQYSFYHEKGADRALAFSSLPELDDSIKAIHVGSYSLVVSPTSETLGALVEREGKNRLVTLDPNVRLKIEKDKDRWRDRIGFFASHADIIKVSDEDLESLYDNGEGSDKAQEWLAGRTQLVIVTRGVEGVSVFTRSGRIDLPTEPVEAVDTVGAGDTFQAALLCWLDEHDRSSQEAVAALTDDEIKRMVTFANRAAGVTCTRQGPDLPYRRELADSE
ncbi:carbohydrate kinase family protein [Carnimonas bestiolae]|uniref:carbohydrate kinase family protein n=1 Tax=Carnimonas bestiolae TaxID=3402172 RepID=UPI003EDBFC7E